MQLFNMGGYENYVWSAYGVTLIVFGINIIMMMLEKRRVKKILKHFYES